jgi:hypothetical protein
MYFAQHLALLKEANLVAKYLQLHKEYKLVHRSSPLLTLFRFPSRFRGETS